MSRVYPVLHLGISSAIFSNHMPYLTCRVVFASLVRRALCCPPRRGPPGQDELAVQSQPGRASHAEPATQRQPAESARPSQPGRINKPESASRSQRAIASQLESAKQSQRARASEAEPARRSKPDRQSQPEPDGHFISAPAASYLQGVLVFHNFCKWLVDAWARNVITCNGCSLQL